MPAPLSNDLRKRIIDSKLRGDTEEKIASDKAVHKSTVTKLCSLYRATGSYFPRPNPSGRKPMLSIQQLEDTSYFVQSTSIRQAIEHQPDITLKELILVLCTKYE